MCSADRRSAGRAQNVDFVRTRRRGRGHPRRTVRRSTRSRSPGSSIRTAARSSRTRTRCRVWAPSRTPRAGCAPHPATRRGQPRQPAAVGLPVRLDLQADPALRLLPPEVRGREGAAPPATATAAASTSTRTGSTTPATCGAGPTTTSTRASRAPAVRDLELTFEERWRATAAAPRWPSTRRRDEHDSAPAPTSCRSRAPTSRPPTRHARSTSRPTATARSPTRCSPRSARRASSSTSRTSTSRRREAYRDGAAARRSTEREIDTLVIVLPVDPGPAVRRDRPRTAFVGRPHAADAGAGIVRVGYPRRHFTVADNELRASSGRLLLCGGPAGLRRRRSDGRSGAEGTAAAAAVLVRGRGRADVRLQRVDHGQPRRRHAQGVRGRARRRHPLVRGGGSRPRRARAPARTRPARPRRSSTSPASTCTRR